jgi:bifunctional DNA-binding transcriptional regulator/antitoxin component of YhaV-PrlF toxin-antitoxin module
MITTVNPKGQVTIPEPLRARYGFPAGAKVIWLERDGDLIPKPLLSLAELAGRYPSSDVALTEALLAERALDHERESD